MKSFPSELLVDIRKHLEAEASRTKSRIDELYRQDPFQDPDRLIDNAASDTEASEESNHDRVAALISELKSGLSEITAALSRIKDGSYGFCTNCRQMIDTDRLAILPTATLCLSCEKRRAHR